MRHAQRYLNTSSFVQAKGIFSLTVTDCKPVIKFLYYRAAEIKMLWQGVKNMALVLLTSLSNAHKI